MSQARTTSVLCMDELSRHHMKWIVRIGAGHLLYESEEVAGRMAALKRWVTLPVRDLQGGEQIHDAVAHDSRCVCRTARPARNGGAARLGTFQGLDERFLVDTEHNRVLRRVRGTARRRP